jgi:glycyl-tRNA synthetase
MAPHIRSSKLTLGCPLFAADFDPRNNDFLLVGGGGGEGRSGVGNQIASITLPVKGFLLSWLLSFLANRTIVACSIS